MKKIFLCNISSLTDKDLKNNSLIKTDNINEADMVLANVSKDLKSNFELPVNTTITIAQAQALDLPIVTFGYDQNKAANIGKKMGIKYDKLNLPYISNAKKLVNNQEQDLGKFLYENLNGNGMIFNNNNILNIYDNEPFKALEILKVLSTNPESREEELSLFKNLTSLNNYIKKGYENCSIFTQRELTNNSSKEFNPPILENVSPKTTYLIGDDVFFIEQTENKTLIKETLLQDRTNESKRQDLEPIVPAELAENNDYNLNNVINNNNSYAKHIKSFQANLHKMPLEKSSVDTGSLYEIALIVASGGKGVVNVDDTIFSQPELFDYLTSNQNIIVLKNATNVEMAVANDSLLRNEDLPFPFLPLGFFPNIIYNPLI